MNTNKITRTIMAADVRPGMTVVGNNGHFTAKVSYVQTDKFGVTDLYGHSGVRLGTFAAATMPVTIQVDVPSVAEEVASR